MPDFYHSALRGKQLHEAKIKILPVGSPVPVAEWEGQFVAIGKNLYYSVLQNGTLGWIQPTASNIPILPANVVVFESGTQNPPSPRTGGGRLYTNTITKDMWYLSGSQWIKLGTTNNNSSSFEIISGRTGESGNHFGLLNPTDPLQDNCLFIKKWQPATKYYLAIQSPTISSLGGSDDNFFYFELWRSFSVFLLSTHGQSQESLATIDTTLNFTNTTEFYRLGVYIRRNATKLYLNFTFNLDTRLIKIEGLASISYGY